MAKAKECSSLLTKLEKEDEHSLHVGDRGKVVSYDVMYHRFVQFSDVFRKIVKTTYYINDELLSINAGDRDTFFRRVQFAMSFLVLMDKEEAIAIGKPNSHRHEQDCVGHIKSKIVKIAEAAEKDEIWLDVLRAMEECLEDASLKIILQEARSGTLRKQKGRWEVLKSACIIDDHEWQRWLHGDMGPLNKVTDGLLLMKEAAITTKIASVMMELNGMIDKVLSHYQVKENGSVFISNVARELRGQGPRWLGLANKMIDEHSAFDGVKTAIRNRQFTKTIAEVLQAMDGTDYDPDGPKLPQLNMQSEKYDDEYYNLREPLLDDDLSDDQVESLMVDMVAECRKVAALPDISRADKIRTLMAHIFACWTIDKSRKEYLAHKKTDETEAADYLKRPHPGQILALFRIFGLDEVGSLSKGSCGSDRMSIVKSAVEIGTGEGKSVTLAVTAMILALLGYEVDIVCYSEYLTDRDRLSFAKFFQRFSLQDSIKYGTFKDVCEKFLNNRGDVREAVLAAMSCGEESSSGRGAPKASISSSAPTSPNQPADAPRVSPPRILLIDEVDVFFQDGFYKVALVLAQYIATPLSSLSRRLIMFWYISRSSFYRRMSLHPTPRSMAQILKPWCAKSGHRETIKGS